MLYCDYFGRADTKTFPRCCASQDNLGVDLYSIRLWLILRAQLENMRGSRFEDFIFGIMCPMTKCVKHTVSI